MQTCFCEICFAQRGELVELNCKHELCSPCFLLGVVPKEVCPFCKQRVTEVKQRGQTRSITVFAKPKPNVDFFEESHFDLVNNDFFAEDIVVLNENLERAYQMMVKTNKQIDPKFNEKWFIFERIEQEIRGLELHDNVVYYKEVVNLNRLLALMMGNHWETDHFLPYREIYKATRGGDEELLRLVSVKEKKKKKQKRKQQGQH